MSSNVYPLPGDAGPVQRRRGTGPGSLSWDAGKILAGHRQRNGWQPGWHWDPYAGRYVAPEAAGMVHVIVHLPDGRTACADVDDPVVGVMRRINAAVAAAPDARFPGAKADYAAVAAWLDGREHQSRLCLAHVCEHRA